MEAQGLLGSLSWARLTQQGHSESAWGGSGRSRGCRSHCRAGSHSQGEVNKATPGWRLSPLPGAGMGKDALGSIHEENAALVVMSCNGLIPAESGGDSN